VKGSAYTIGYAAVLGSACALLLTAAASFTKPYKEANQKAEEALNILLALKVPLPEGVSSRELVETREKNVRENTLGDITTYDYSPPDANGKVLATALRFAGPGLWGPVKGFLALEPDMKTIRGMTIYEQEETPGLGGEIVGEPAANKVDGISGATMTCDKMQAMLNEAIERIVEEKQ